MNRYNQILILLQSLSDEQINELLSSITMNPQTNKDKDVNIENILKELCVNPSLLGFGYLKSAIEICLENRDMLSGITKRLYPMIAKKHDTTAHRVERAIRHAIETSWGKVSGDIYHEVFFNELDKPTNSRYIAYVCSYIKNISDLKNEQQTQKVLK